MAEPTDAELIALSMRDGTAFEAIHRRHYHAVYARLVRRYGPRVAEEVAGEVFQVAWKRRADYDQSRPDARPWLYGIADKLGQRELRRRAREKRRRGRASSEPSSPEARFDAVDDRLHAAWASPRVAGVLNALPAGERDVILLFAWGNRSYFQIAIELDIPEGTVRSRITSARQKIQEAISDEDPPSDPEPPRGNLK